MRTNFKNTAGVMALTFTALAPLAMQAQPMYDRIKVNLPYTVTLQNKTLQPGDYTIQQLPSTSGSSRVLLFYTNDGMKFETSAMTIPALDINTARDTKLVLNHLGDDYYISKIWVQGKDYGYELPMPDSMKSRQNERMTEATLAATNHPSSNAEMTTTTADSAAPAAPVETAPPANANSNNTADTANRPVADTTATTPTVTAEVTQPATQPVTPEATPAATPAATPDTSADRAMPDQSAPDGSADRTSMPSTAAGWLTMLLSGSALSGAGMMLRRKR